MSDEFKILDYEKLSEELKTYAVKLIEPSSYPTEVINKKLVKIQSYKDRVQSIYEDAISNRNILEKKLNDLEEEFEREKERLMINDKEIQELSSQDKRNAALNNKLKDKLEKIRIARNHLLDAKDFESKVKSRYANLESTNKNISRLISTLGIMFMRGELKINPDAKGTKLNIGTDE